MAQHARLAVTVAVGLASLAACSLPGRQPDAPPLTCQQPRPSAVWLSGVGYSPYHPGQDPNKGRYPSASDVAADMPTLICLTHNIRVYSSEAPAQEVVQAAERAHMSVNLGIWLGRDAAANESEITAGLHLLSSPAVTTVNVGSEVLLRKDMTEAQLRTDIQRVRTAARRAGHRVQVTTSEVDQMWLAHPELAADVDVITTHTYPYWDRTSIANAIQNLDTRYQHLRATFPGREVVVGETGWPSDGPAQGPAVPSEANQGEYLRALIAWADQQSPAVSYYYFSAFDESWKVSEGGMGPHWGMYLEDGTLKSGLRGLLPTAAPETILRRRSQL